MGGNKADILQGTLDLLVLKTLETMGPLHGWAIAKRIEQVSANALGVNQGTLYPALLRLQQKGWVSAKWGTSENNRRAKFYSLTRKGEKQLAVEAKNWEEMVAIVTRIKPEKEQLYRSLHQTVWPGVSDQLIRTHNRNLSIFLVELGDDIYEFLYVEYVGDNAEADGQASKEDPCTVRWWKLTDACQLPLPDQKEGIWSGMESVLK